MTIQELNDEMCGQFSEGKREWTFEEMVELTQKYMQVTRKEAEQIVHNSRV